MINCFCLDILYRVKYHDIHITSDKNGASKCTIALITELCASSLEVFKDTD
jgi:hypothetical protein